MTKIEQNRRFMHCPSFYEGMKLSDQASGVKPPAFGKEIVGELIVLPSFEPIAADVPYTKLLDARRSVRSYDAEYAMTQAELAFMLWSVNGIQRFRDDVATFRPVPSGGARHPFETYFVVKSVEGLKPGLYHYLPTENIGEKRVTIEFLGDMAQHEETVTEMVAGQVWVAKASVLLLYSCIPYKAEWRYHEMSHRVQLIDLGHVGQNAMLSAVALGLGSCCLAAYNQVACDKQIGLDGLEEYTVYGVAVGKES
ncbi:MAG: SagB/ThcOx family dehydrogenase [Defluviitaleaceae bacterium]|nr:SagB/ThcOx family dehydrogenase [Defluviitaleaceae bacterium]